MKALLSRRPGGPDTLSIEEVETPRPGTGDVLIRVEACGVNFPDALLIRDLYQVKPPRPFSPGAEIVGVVTEAGPDVTALRPGDRVIGRCGWGGMAQGVVLPASRCTPIPESMPAVEAAAFLFACSTSYYALKTVARLGPGDVLLVLGAAGGVGLAAVAIGRALGARVIAAVSSEAKLDFARRHGAEAGLVYPREVADPETARTLSARFKDAVGGRGCDVVLDPVGGLYSEAALRAMARGGRHLVVGFTAGIPRIPLNLLLLKSCQVIGVDWRSFIQHEPVEHEANTRDLLALYEAGTVRPVVTETFPLERGANAIARLESRELLGKIVVTMDHGG